MSRFDFNKAADFAIATASVTNDLLNAFARDQSVWRISEGSYRGGRRSSREVLFHIFKTKSEYQAGLERIVDNTGRRKAKFAYPYVDGQTTDDLGRKGESFEVEVLLHGPSYRVGLTRLMKELNDPIPGVLTHPVFGTIRCAAEDIVREHSAHAKQAVLLRIRFTEHNFDFGFINEIASIKTLKSALQSIIAALQKIAAVIAAIKQIVATVVSGIEGIRQKIMALYNAALNLAANAAAAFKLSSGDLAAVLPVNQGGTVAPKTTGAPTAGGVNPKADPTQFGGGGTTTNTAGISGTSIGNGGFIIVSTRFTTVVQPADPFANLPLNLLGDVAREAIQTEQIRRSIETLRAMANEIAADVDAAIAALSTSNVAAGKSAAAHLSLLDAKISGLSMCDAMAQMLDSGTANGRPVIVSYTVPHTMSIREAAFLNHLSPQDGNDIATLNPELESVNLIPKGTAIMVPAFV